MKTQASRARAGRWCGLALAVLATAPGAPAQTVGGGFAEITVTGERPGPEMWRVSKGDHTLWLLGVLDPLPKRMTWRSAKVESIVASAELVLPARPSVTTAAGPFALIALYFDWRRTQRLPGETTLRDQVPGPLYARFAALCRQFGLHESGLEHLRPIVAAQKLYERALADSGLNSNGEVDRIVRSIAHRHHVPVRESVIRVEDPKGLLAELRGVPVSAELKCFEATVARLETDLPAMRNRASAWAVGDVDALRRLPAASQRATCWELVDLSPRLRVLADAARQERLRVADETLATHRSAFAMAPIDQLLAPDGLLATFRARGYQVDGP
jgi:uncharacterized protein YbaP (TraB family)